MRDLVASMIADGGRAAYERFLFVKFALLQDTLRKAGPQGMAAADYLKGELLPFESLNAEVLVRQGTPFFWMNVLRAHLERKYGGEFLESYARHLIMTAFDSFFTHLPDGSAVELRPVGGSDVILPALGVKVEASGRAARLRRVDEETLEVTVGGSRSVICLTDVAPEHRLTVIRIPGHERSRLLVGNDPALFEREYINAIAPSPPAPRVLALVEKIGRSLDLIEEVDPTLFAQYDSLIRWYVPVTTPDPNTRHNSFTAKNALGLMFLSETYKFTPLLEAMVHEFHHAEMYMLMAISEVFGPDIDDLFYSPWRPDARPLHGLFHADHVFSGVADFYSLAEKSEAMSSYLEEIRIRRVQLYYQLRLGLAQIPFERLAPVGKQITEFMWSQLERNAEELGSLDEEWPTEVAEHLKTWTAKYPELAPHVRMPDESLSKSPA
jgi:HEXXH motif-containing protein